MKLSKSNFTETVRGRLCLAAEYISWHRFYGWLPRRIHDVNSEERTIETALVYQQEIAWIFNRTKTRKFSESLPLCFADPSLVRRLFCSTNCVEFSLAMPCIYTPTLARTHTHAHTDLHTHIHSLTRNYYIRVYVYKLYHVSYTWAHLGGLNHPINASAASICFEN